MALLVPRRWHATSGSLKGQGKMMEAILQAGRKGIPGVALGGFA